jgi:hypothetical protein
MLKKKQKSLQRFMFEFEKLTEECEKENASREVSLDPETASRRPSLIEEIWRVTEIVARGNEDVTIPLSLELWFYFKNKRWTVKKIWYQARHRKGSHMRTLLAQVNNFITPEADIIYQQLKADETNERKFHRYEALLQLHGGVIESIEKHDEW